MRRVILGAVAAAALAWTQSALAGDTKAKTGQSGQMDERSAGQQPGSGSAVTAQEASRERRGGGQQGGVFEGKDNFDVDGRVSQASASELTIERKELPPAKLKIGPTTKVEVDGARASAAQLEPGQEVKASFNLRGGDAEAVEVKANKAKGDDRRKLQEQRQESRQEMQKDAQKDTSRQQAR